MTKLTAPVEQPTPALPEPTAGGSYTRDPITGALTRNTPSGDTPTADTQKQED